MPLQVGKHSGKTWFRARKHVSNSLFTIIKEPSTLPNTELLNTGLDWDIKKNNRLRE